MIRLVMSLVALALASELTPLLIRSHQARVASLVFGCVFLAVWFCSRFPLRHDAGRELQARRVRDLRAGRG